MNVEIVGPEIQRESECEAVLRTLPAWFGIEEALLKYARNSVVLPTFALADARELAGFVTLQEHFAEAWEIHCIAIRSDARGKGLGTRLLSHAETWLAARGVRFLQVKTLAATRESEAYAETRAFYASRGFAPIEIFPTLWDAGNPALLSIKTLTAG